MYCSYEARKVIETLDEYGMTLPDDDYISLEQDIGRFWNTHIQKIVNDVTKPKTVERFEVMGWAYYKKPVISLLTPRGGAHRTEPVDFGTDEWTSQVYRLVSSSLLLADFNMKELAILCGELPKMVTDVQALSAAISACKRQGSRSIYYLHGVIRREYQTTQGRIQEIQRQSAEPERQGWDIPEGFEKMDVIERRSLAQDWQDQLNNIAIQRALDS
jgi:hypothetical protein